MLSAKITPLQIAIMNRIYLADIVPVLKENRHMNNESIAIE